MLRLVLTIVTMVAIMSTTSCGTPSSQATPTPSVDLRGQFLEYVRAKSPSTSGIIALSDKQLLTNGDGTCAALRGSSGRTPSGIASSYDRTWPGAGATLVGAAVAYLCPEFADRADD